MAIVKAKGQITIIDQNDAISFQAFIGSNQPLTQIYSQDNNQYVPNWSVSPYLVLTPQLFISGIPGDSIAVAGRVKAGSAQWRKGETLITNGGDYAIQTVAPFSLTVKKNENTGGGNVKYQFSAILVDPNNGLETAFTSVISFNTVTNAGSGLLAIITADQGTIFQNDMIQSLTLSCDLFRASELLTANVEYTWAIRDLGVFAPTTAQSAASTGQKNVTFSNVNNVIPGSAVTIGATTFRVASVNTTSKVVTMETNIPSAIASGATISCPFYDPSFGTGWGKITSASYFNGITGFATKTLTIPANAVLNLEVFKCISKDNSTGSSTSGQSAQAVETLNDMSDPIYIEISSPDGDVIKNGAGSIRLSAEVWRGGEEIDTGGTGYSYQWSKFDRNGVADSAFNQTGKNITILPSDVSAKATFVCRLMTI